MSASADFVGMLAGVAAGDTEAVHLRDGMVAATPGGGVLTVTIDGTDLDGLPYLTSYATPTVGDVVVLVVASKRMVVLGALTPPT